MALLKFDPWKSSPRAQVCAYRAYSAYPTAELGTLGTIGTVSWPDNAAYSAAQRRRQWLFNLGNAHPKSQLLETALRLAKSPWSLRFADLGWSDEEIFGVPNDSLIGRTLLQHLAVQGTRVRAATRTAAWLGMIDGACRRHDRRTAEASITLVWDQSRPSRRP